MITQKELAKILNLTQATVSLCFSQPHKVAEATRKKILKTAIELGYRPNLSARSLRNQRMDAFAILESELSYENNPDIQVFRGAAIACEKIGKQLVLKRVQHHLLHSGESIYHLLTNLLADGVLMNFNLDIAPHLEELLGYFWLPTIWINSKMDYNCVYPDDVQAGYDLTQHLLSLGHRRILYVDTPPSSPEHYSRKDRFSGYKKAMEEAYLEPDILHIPLRINQDPQKKSEIVQRFLYPSRATAIVSYSLAIAMTCVELVRQELGWKVPSQFSFATIDVQPPWVGFSVTAVTIPFFELGVQAVHLLVDKQKDSTQPVRSKKINCPFYKGDSTQPVPCDDEKK